jgi:phosphoglycolate phosphatase-like HAD superfamily hydrolase
MTIDLLAKLREASQESLWRGVASEALKLIASAPIDFESRSERGELASSLARIYERRRKLNREKGRAISGLDETISALRRREVVIKLGILRNVKGTVIILVAHDTDDVVGLMVIHGAHDAIAFDPEQPRVQ